MKAILLSIKPKYVAKILNGEKTIEIRKTMPKCDLPIDVYIYCTKDNHQLVKPKDYDKYLLFTNGAVKSANETSLNGKIVAKFRCYKVEEIKNNLAMRFFTESFNEKELLEKSCLNSDEIFWYLAPQKLKVECCGYAWHISNLEIFDKPKELSEFYITHITIDVGKKIRTPLMYPRRLTKAPQSWCYVEVLL